MSSKINFCPRKRSSLRTYAGSFMGPNHPLKEVENGEQIGGGLVQKPHIYIIAKCRDVIEDQLLYSETRLEDINELENQLLSSQKVSIKDICRFFHGTESSFAGGGKWRADWRWLWVLWMHWSISQLYWPCDVVHWGHHTLPSNKEEERYWKVQLEKKEEIVKCILSKTWANW